MNKLDPKNLAGYDEDFALWSAEQSALLRSGRLDKIDLDNVAEEIESLGRSDRHEIANRLTVILTHLLKYQFQPGEASNSWAASIVQNRDAIATLIEESPSLRPHPGRVLERAYRPARLAASGETGLPLATFPAECPFSIDQVLDLDFWPGQTSPS
jgi:Domain of unknown function DUF29